jgi:hypothetical protein
MHIPCQSVARPRARGPKPAKTPRKPAEKFPENSEKHRKTPLGPNHRNGGGKTGLTPRKMRKKRGKRPSRGLLTAPVTTSHPG